MFEIFKCFKINKDNSNMNQIWLTKQKLQIRFKLVSIQCCLHSYLKTQSTSKELKTPLCSEFSELEVSPSAKQYLSLYSL